MPAASRRKGRAAEQDVSRIFKAAGLDVRQAQRSRADEPDCLVFAANGLTFSVETKRNERVRVVEWSRQAEECAPQGTVPLVVYRPSREPWRVNMRLDDLLAVLVAVTR